MRYTNLWPYLAYVYHIKYKVDFRTYYETRQSSSCLVVGPCSELLAGARGRRWNSAYSRESRETVKITTVYNTILTVDLRTYVPLQK